MIIEFLNETNLTAGLITFLAFILVLSLSVYLVSARFLQAGLSKSHERVGRILFRVSASLLALVLSLTFANQRVSYFTVKASLENEASKLVDMHVDLGLYGTAEALQIERQVRDYVKRIIDDGWIPLYASPYESEQFNAYLSIYTAVNGLQPENERQRRLQTSILDDLDVVSDLWQRRAFSTIKSSSPLIAISFLGLILTMILFGIYPPSKKLVFLVSCYVLFAGTILYFVLVMSNPLRGPLKIDPGPFKVLQETIDKNL